MSKNQITIHLEMNEAIEHALDSFNEANGTSFSITDHRLVFIEHVIMESPEEVPEELRSQWPWR